MITSMVIFQVYLICCLKVRMDMFDDHPKEVSQMMPVVYSLIPLPVITACLGVYLDIWLHPQVTYMNTSVGVEEMADMRKLAEDDANAEDTLGDRFLHPTFSQPLATPMVDRRIKHLLPRVYRGRLSISRHPGTVRKGGAQGDFESKFGTSIGNASTLFGSDVLDTDTMMDERDRRDFDGAATPVPFEQYSSGATAINGKGLSRSYSVDSNVSHGDGMEMMRLGSGRRGRGDSASSSQADLLGHAQDVSGRMSDRDMNDTMLWRSNSSVNRFNGAVNGGNGRIAADRDLDPIDLYDGPSNNASIGDMYLAAYSPKSADPRSPAGGGGPAGGPMAMGMSPMQQHQRPAMRPPPPSNASLNAGFSGSMRGAPSPDYFGSGARLPNAPMGVAGPPRPRQGFTGASQQPRPQQMGMGPPRPQQFGTAPPRSQQMGMGPPRPQQFGTAPPRPPQPPPGPQRNIPKWD
ncbi:hypothetical protein LPJ56_005102 [Coemansia sp. RSA 2599]|nr:hypothetical protein LPJ56_005102 [Coemansia sp. RSA 2599]